MLSDAARRTIRTALAAVLTVAALVPVALHEAGVSTDALPRWALGVIALLAAFTRIMNTTAVETFLQQFAPWLSATGTTPPPAVIGGADPTAPVVVGTTDSDQVAS